MDFGKLIRKVNIIPYFSIPMYFEDLNMKQLRAIVCCLFLSLVGLVNSSLYAQNEHYFLNKETQDTIARYKLLVYYSSDSVVYKPKTNHALYLKDKDFKNADSLVLHYDSWYKEHLLKEDFNQTNIYVNKQLPLEEVILESKSQTIGTFNKLKSSLDLKLVPEYQLSGSLVSFELPDNTKAIQDFQLRIKRKERGEASIMPVLFMADSIDDPNKIYLYPKLEPYLVEDELTRRYQWISIPIKNDLTVFKKLIFAGFYGNKKDKIFYNFAEARANTFQDYYPWGRVFLNGKPTRADGTIWDNRFIYRTEDYTVPAVKLKLLLY